MSAKKHLDRAGYRRLGDASSPAAEKDEKVPPYPSCDEVRARLLTYQTEPRKLSDRWQVAIAFHLSTCFACREEAERGQTAD